jgi:hypothetical protein
MATGTVVFQSGTLASPPVGLAVMADAVNDASLGAGTAQYIKIMDGQVGGTAKAAVTTTNGLSVDVTRVQGTVQALGSVQSVGTGQVLGSVQPVGTGQVLGTIQLHGTNQALGSVAVQGYAAHGAGVQGAPVLFGGFGSSGTQAAVDDGDAVRAWFDLNGRLQVRGTIDSMPAVTGTVQTHGTSQIIGTVQPHGTTQALGTFQSHGTNQALGTVQPLAGSVHLATNMAGGTVVAVGSALHGAAADTRPLLIAAFGSSGTQAAVDDGDAVRLAADLNGRIWANIQTFAGTIGGGTVQVHGTTQALGTVQTHGTSQVLGTIQTHGTTQALGTVRALAPVYVGESFFGTTFTGNAAANGTLIPAPAQGTYLRIYDVLVSGSAAGTALIELGDGTQFGHVFFADKGGWSFNSAKGVRSRGTSLDMLCTYSAGSWGVMVNYALET